MFIAAGSVAQKQFLSSRSDSGGDILRNVFKDQKFNVNPSTPIQQYCTYLLNISESELKEICEGLLKERTESDKKDIQTT